MFIMNFKEIHSNAEFLSMYRIVGQGLAPAKIKSNNIIYRKADWNLGLYLGNGTAN